MNNFQRVGSISNAHIGREFEDIALNYFKKNNIHLIMDVSLPVGINEVKKNHRFDLGTGVNADKKVLVECKSHRWTSGDNVPSAKLTVWNEAMY